VRVSLRLLIRSHLFGQPHVASVYKALATGASAAGLAIGDVKTSVTLTPPPLPEAGRAVLAAVAAGLTQGGAWTSTAGEESGSGPFFFPTLLLDSPPLASPSPLTCTVLRLVAAAPRPPMDIALTFSVAAGRARRLAAMSLLGEAPDPATVRAELAGIRCCVLPAFEEFIITDVQARWDGDGALVGAWEAALGGPLDPPVWVWAFPGDGREDGGRATPGALCVPPVALWEAPGLVNLPPESRAGGGGAGLVRRVADAVGGSVVFSGRLEPVGVVVAEEPAPAACAASFTSASALAPGGGGGWDTALPPIKLAALPEAAAAAAGAHRARQHHQSEALRSLLMEARGGQGGGSGGCDAAAAVKLAAARAALASAVAHPPPGGIPCLGVRIPYALGVVGRGRASAAAGGGRGGGRGAAAGGKKRAAAVTTTATPTATDSAVAAPKALKAAKPAPSAAEAAARVTKVRSAWAAGGEAALGKLTVDDLKAFLKAAGVAVGGKKEVLVGRVVGVVGGGGGGV